MGRALVNGDIVTRNRQMRAIEIRMHAKQLAKLLDIDPATFSGRELPAAVIMAMMVLMAAEPDKTKREGLITEILQNGGRVLPRENPENHMFWVYVTQVVADMREVPSWRFPFNTTTEQLMKLYWWIDHAIDVLDALNFGSGLTVTTGPFVAGGLQALQTPRPPGVRAGVTTIARGAVRGGANSFTGGFKGGPAVLWVIGLVVAKDAREYRTKMRIDIQRRYQEGTMTVQQYQKALGDDEPLPARYLYDLHR